MALPQFFNPVVVSFTYEVGEKQKPAGYEMHKLR